MTAPIRVPPKKGVTLGLAKLPELFEALQMAEQRVQAGPGQTACCTTWASARVHTLSWTHFDTTTDQNIIETGSSTLGTDLGCSP